MTKHPNIVKAIHLLTHKNMHRSLTIKNPANESALEIDYNRV